MIGVTTLLSLFMIVVRRNIFFGLVILWALYGIALKREQVDEVLFQEVIKAAWAAFIIVIMSIMICLFKAKKFNTQS
jgi:soluble lytic murein transglycosylase-like protein